MTIANLESQEEANRAGLEHVACFRHRIDASKNIAEITIDLQQVLLHSKEHVALYLKCISSASYFSRLFFGASLSLALSNVWSWICVSLAISLPSSHLAARNGIG